MRRSNKIGLAFRNGCNKLMGKEPLIEEYHDIVSAIAQHSDSLAGKKEQKPVLDALNGGHFEPISIDWENYQSTLSVTRSELKSIQSLMSSLIKEKYILAVQVKLYDVTLMHGKSHWQSVLKKI